MPSVAKVARLPRKLREELEQMWLEGGHTDKELAAHISARGGNVSYDNVRRYTAGLSRRMERYQEAQQVAAVWVARLGKEPEGNVGRLLIEMLRMVAFRQLADMGDAKARGSAKPAEIAMLAKAIKEMEAATNTIAQREKNLREKLKTDLDRKVDQMKDGAGAPGDAATLAKAKELVRGLI